MKNNKMLLIKSLNGSILKKDIVISIFKHPSVSRVWARTKFKLNLV
jgi:hypothetical protein